MSDGRARVVFVINDLRRAGAETQLVRLATGLDRSRHEARVVILKTQSDFAAELDAASVPVAALGRRSPWDVLVLWRLYRQLAAARPQIVHSFLPFANLLTAIAARWAGVPVVILSQRASYEATLTPFWRRVARWSHRRASHVIVNSEAARQEEIAAGFPAERITCIPNGIRPPALPIAVDRAALGLPGGSLVLCAAQLAPEKGHAALLEAWERVERSHGDATLALLGDGPLRPALEAQARRLGLRRLLFLGFRHPAPSYIAASDLVVLSSLTEGMPNAVLEAMAAERPVVATRVGGLAEIIRDGETGVLVPAGDAQALAAATLALLGDAPRRQALGGGARKHVEQHHTIPLLCARTAAVYASCLGSPAGAGGRA